jgi:hypothetical protein
MSAMTVAWLGLAFGVFMAALWSVYALNRLCTARYGYAPFSVPNAALMLVVNLLLLSVLSGHPGGQGLDEALAGTDWAASIKLLAAALLALAMLVIIGWRTRPWIALYAVPLMAVGAIAILPSLLFQILASAGDGPEPP